MRSYTLSKLNLIFQFHYWKSCWGVNSHAAFNLNNVNLRIGKDIAAYSGCYAVISTSVGFQQLKIILKSMVHTQYFNYG